jgi:RNA polymerase sigma factor (sigma-70 family)
MATQLKEGPIPTDTTWLVGQLKERNRAGMEYLYDHYAPALLGIIGSIVHDADLAEEILHDALMKIWDKAESYSPEKGRFFTWMASIARNLSIDKVRSGTFQRGKATQSDDTIPDTGSKSGWEDGIGLKEIMSQLDGEQLQVVELIYYQGYTHSEVSEEYNIPLGTVKTRVRLALLKIRKLVGLN